MELPNHFSPVLRTVTSELSESSVPLSARRLLPLNRQQPVEELITPTHKSCTHTPELSKPAQTPGLRRRQRTRVIPSCLTRKIHTPRVASKLATATLDCPVPPQSEQTRQVRKRVSFSNESCSSSTVSSRPELKRSRSQHSTNPPKQLKKRKNKLEEIRISALLRGQQHAIVDLDDSLRSRRLSSPRTLRLSSSSERIRNGKADTKCVTLSDNHPSSSPAKPNTALCNAVPVVSVTRLPDSSHKLGVAIRNTPGALSMNTSATGKSRITLCDSTQRVLTQSSRANSIRCR
ncbi:unnamed protein product [Echinostoma caproni]|uniref:Uncharacterized protein n=1 Tax=Echinostoma caproni TaxID=27848 RepID=A0A183BEZ9_9TREM|nr:unnamed protein product [Echinostoma caproni]